MSRLWVQVPSLAPFAPQGAQFFYKVVIVRTEGMTGKVLSFIEEWDLVRCGETILVAVSGGKDSMALLHFLSNHRETLEIKVIAAYFDHLIREGSGEVEARLIRSYCDQLDVPFVTGQGRSRERAAQTKGESLEESARNLRNAFLSDKCEELNADRIALAHHMSDLSETILMRIARGTGVRGLTGMAPIRDRIIRPFLCLKVQEIISYVTINEIPYSLDDTNVVEVFERNLVRNRVLPELKKLNPEVLDSFYRLFENANDIQGLLNSLVEKELKRFKKINDVLIQEVDSLTKVDRSLVAEVAREIVSRMDESGYTPTRERIRTFLGCLFSQNRRWTVEFKGSVKASRIGKYVFFYKGDLIIPKETEEQVISELPYSGDFNIGRIRILFSEKCPEKIDGADLSVCSENKLRLPLKVRRTLPGDKMIPFGMKREREVERIIHDAGETAFLDQTVVVEDREGNILWVPGIRTSEICRCDFIEEKVVVLWLERR
ncbi:MAG: tRNA(Ile)-lysidine synthase [Thermotogales bacterium 46_20]|nr:MAG: tRNA(Ile)-lysidine synthase [Thermotogales bacterium 46_20]